MSLPFCLRLMDIFHIHPDSYLNSSANQFDVSEGHDFFFFFPLETIPVDISTCVEASSFYGLGPKIIILNVDALIPYHV